MPRRVDSNQRIIRVFPRRTKATPTDDLAYVGDPTLFAEADKVMVSCTFTWDIPEAERLAEAWKWIAPVELGGPAFGNPGGEFVPGMFLRHGYTITSRGCNNKCWFCYVWRRSGTLRELPIMDGWIVQDDNLLSCSDQHIRDVFAMLKRQPEKPRFTGGLEARLLQEWHAQLLKDARSMVYFSYDLERDYEPLVEASRIMQRYYGKKSHDVGCYVLIGYPKDTEEKAERRMRDVLALGLMPFAMLWRNDEGKYDPDWRKFQRLWAAPQIIYGRSYAKAC